MGKRSAAETIGIAAVLVALAGAVALEAEPARSSGPQEGLTVVLDDLLDHPTDLAFNPHDGSLWIVNDTAGDERDSTVVVRGLGAAEQQAERFPDSGRHYLADPTGIAFAASGDEHATSAFLGGGPTLWTSRAEQFRGGIESHLDMVHWTQPALGIATGADAARREYWVVNGSRGSIDRYRFNKPHVLGGTNHADGRVFRYVPQSLRPVRGLPSHVEFDARTKVLYVADTGNGRVARLPTAGLRTNGRRLEPVPRIPERLFAVRGGRVTTLAAGLATPVGLALKDGRLYVGEHATGRIVVLSLDGRRLGSIDTGVGTDSLTGLAAGPDGALYALDSRRNRVLRVPA
jgi:DNA-binding beta-propeller fold protein YncE